MSGLDLYSYSLMLLIWWEHNNCSFEDYLKLVDYLKSLLIRTLFDWSRIILPLLIFNIPLEFLFDLFVIVACILYSSSLTWNTFFINEILLFIPHPPQKKKSLFFLISRFYALFLVPESVFVNSLCVT